MAVYGYARVSSKEQNLARQMKILLDAGVDSENIKTDKASGKNFDRTEYIGMISKLKPGDVVTICSIDRLGRDYTEIMNQWNIITNEKRADIKVLDMPLLDTSRDGKTLENRFVADLVLQILSYVAQKERESIRKRQREGVDAMPEVNGKKISAKTGRAVGRPELVKPENWGEVYADWKAGNITAVEAMRQTGTKRTSFYKLVSMESAGTH